MTVPTSTDTKPSVRIWFKTIGSQTIVRTYTSETGPGSYHTFSGKLTLPNVLWFAMCQSLVMKNMNNDRIHLELVDEDASPTMQQSSEPEPEEWICVNRPGIDNMISLCWFPKSWAPSDENPAGYAIAVSRKGILIGEVSLDKIPSHIISQVYHAFKLLVENDHASNLAVLSMATHERIRKGIGWHIRPVPGHTEGVSA